MKRVHRVHSTGIAMPALKKEFGPEDRRLQGGLPPVPYRQSSGRIAAVANGYVVRDKVSSDFRDCEKGKGWNTDCHRGFFVNVKAT